MKVEVLNMTKKENKGDWVNLVALVDVRLDDKIELFGIRILKDMEGKFWVAVPSYIIMDQKKKSFVKVIHFTNLKDWEEVKTTVINYYQSKVNADGR